MSEVNVSLENNVAATLTLTDSVNKSKHEVNAFADATVLFYISSTTVLF